MKPKHFVLRCLAVLMVWAVAGCEANRYEIVMRSDGATVQRELTCWRERSFNDKTNVGVFPKDELTRIAAAYRVAVPEKLTGKHKFSGTFSSELPQDVGGRGSYTHSETSLGSVSTYVERFRGQDDLSSDVEERQLAVDRLTDLLIGWLASELEAEADFAKLREFLDVRFRRDLKNLALYGWAHGIVSDQQEAADSEYIFRVGQYLVERAYFTPDQMPMLTRAVIEIERDGPARLLAFVQRFTASKMGIAEDQPIPPCLQFLADATAVDASISKYLRGTDDYKLLLAKWERETFMNFDATPPDPNAEVSELVMKAFLQGFHFGPSDQLQVKFATDTAPFLTNGKWEETAGQVRWSHPMLEADSEDSEFPTLLYAMWSRPDVQVQQAHFGRIVLKGEALSNYCLWYRGLNQQEAAEWDEFVSSLQPNKVLSTRLRKFRFSHEPLAGAGDQSSPDLAATPRELLLLGLAAETAPK